VGDVDRQPRHFKALALETIEDQLQGFDPLAVLIQRDAMFTQRQAEQRTVEQTHQTLDILL